jgi:hypothetical protein
MPKKGKYSHLKVITCPYQCVLKKLGHGPRQILVDLKQQR